MALDEGGNGPDGGADAPAAQFVNRLSVRYGISEVGLNFSQDGAGRAQAPVIALSTTPLHLMSFSRTLSRTVASYERAYGRIPEDPALGDS